MEPQFATKLSCGKSKLGIACFTETHEDVLMWAHYASSYSGMCLSYSGYELEKGLSDRVNLVRLAYVDGVPVLEPRHASRTDKAAIQILSQKKAQLGT